MAYVDHNFSISDDDDFEGTYLVQNRAPMKEIALALALLIFGSIGIIIGVVTIFNKSGGNGFFFTILGSILFIPGFYYTRLAYYAYKGYTGFSFSNIPPV